MIPAVNVLPAGKFSTQVIRMFFLVEAEGQFIRIASIRQIQERTKCKPLEAKRRAFIIDDADKMNEESANALLKMLEEPSVVNILILVTARPYSMPQTIISRCQHMRFNPLSTETVAGFLVAEMGMDNQKAIASGRFIRRFHRQRAGT